MSMMQYDRFPHPDHQFTPSEKDGEKCQSCGLYRAQHRSVEWEPTDLAPTPNSQNEARHTIRGYHRKA